MKLWVDQWCYGYDQWEYFVSFNKTNKMHDLLILRKMNATTVISVSFNKFPFMLQSHACRPC